MNKALLLRAFCFSALLCAPEVAAYYGSDGLSWRVFSDWDEPIYFPQMYHLAHLRLVELFRYHEFFEFWNFGSSMPHYLSAALLGRLAVLLGLSIPQCAILLDFGCAWISYVVFTLFFKTLTSDKLVAELSSFFLLLTPWIYPLTSHFSPWAWINIDFNTRSQYVCIPILRGVATQMSYLLFASVFLYFAKISRKESAATKQWFILGMATGLLIYLYLFAWVAISPVIAFSILFADLSRSQLSRNAIKHSVSRATLFALGNVLTSTAGLVWIMAGYSGRALTVENRGNWLVPLDALLIISILCVICRRGRWTLSHAVLAATLVTEIALGNMQQLSASLLTHYHMMIFYLYPLTTGLLAFELLSSRVGRLSARFLLPICFLIEASVVTRKANDYWTKAHSTEDREFHELISYINAELKPNENLAVNGWLNPFDKKWLGRPIILIQPFWINALTNRQTFIRNSEGSEISAEEKELLLGFLFTGTTQNIGSCPESPSTALPDPLWDFAAKQRFGFCQTMEKDRVSVPVCSLLDRGKVDNILWEKEFAFFPGEPLSRFLTLRWTSPMSQYRIYSFDQLSAKRELCGER